MRSEGEHAWQKGMHGMHPPDKIQPVIARAIRILLECILVVENVCIVNF